MLEKIKIFHAYSGAIESLFRLWVRLWHVMLDVICLERFTLRFHCLEHSSFHSYCFVSVQFLLVLRLALVFHSLFRDFWFDSVIDDYLSGLVLILAMRVVSNMLISVGEE